ncbi:MAG: acetolactate synthase small subunit, partial [Clostridia bacterium]|nr:acetolactate synthase small subunit [Clostridia bacterium]
MENIKRIYISALVYNRTGVLLRVAGLFARRGYNVVSLTVSETESPEFSRMTIVSDVEEYKVTMVMQQLSKLEEVIKVINLDEGQTIQSEILL